VNLEPLIGVTQEAQVSHDKLVNVVREGKLGGGCLAMDKACSQNGRGEAVCVRTMKQDQSIQ
jgi:hypothetical protein